MWKKDKYMSASIGQTYLDFQFKSSILKYSFKYISEKYSMLVYIYYKLVYTSLVKYTLFEVSKYTNSTLE